MSGPPANRADTASPVDLADLAELRWTWRVVEAGGNGMGRAAFDSAFAQWIAEHAETNLPFLARVDNRAVGMAWLGVVERIPGPDRWPRRAGLVQSVYVRPQYRDRGIGAALMQVVTTEARRLGLDYLMVHPSERSFSFYRRHGFDDAVGTLELELAGRR
jgi:GNAT superfamily N-acetyltransferase